MAEPICHNKYCTAKIRDWHLYFKLKSSVFPQIPSILPLMSKVSHPSTASLFRTLVYNSIQGIARAILY